MALPHGALHLACNNAGIGGPRGMTGDYPLDGWDRVIGINLSGVFYCLRYEIPAILDAAASAGAKFASYTVLRLPYAVKDVFTAWLETHFPDRAKLVLDRIRSLRHGKLNVSDWGERFRGAGIFADEIAQLFEVTARRRSVSLAIAGVTALLAAAVVATIVAVG